MYVQFTLCVYGAVTTTPCLNMFNPNLQTHLKIDASSERLQKQPSRAVLSKRCFENMQQIYRKTPMPKCDCKATLFKWLLLKPGPWTLNLGPGPGPGPRP